MCNMQICVVLQSVRSLSFQPELKLKLELSSLCMLVCSCVHEYSQYLCINTWHKSKKYGNDWIKGILNDYRVLSSVRNPKHIKIQGVFPLKLLVQCRRYYFHWDLVSAVWKVQHVNTCLYKPEWAGKPAGCDFFYYYYYFKGRFQHPQDVFDETKRGPHLLQSQSFMQIPKHYVTTAGNETPGHMILKIFYNAKPYSWQQKKWILLIKVKRAGWQRRKLWTKNRRLYVHESQCQSMCTHTAGLWLWLNKNRKYMVECCAGWLRSSRFLAQYVATGPYSPSSTNRPGYPSPLW